MEKWSQFYELPLKLYYVSDLGRLKSVDKRTGKINILKPEIHEAGYRRYKLDGHRFRVHRLVAIAFIPNPDNLPEVNHIIPISRGGTDAVDNLEWCSRESNMTHAKELGLLSLGYGIPTSTVVLDYNGILLSEHSSSEEAKTYYNVKIIGNNTVVRRYKDKTYTYTYNNVYNEYVRQYKKKKLIFIHKPYYDKLSTTEIKAILKWAQQ